MFNVIILISHYAFKWLFVSFNFTAQWYFFLWQKFYIFV